MTILAIDTAANFCAACLWDDSANRLLASKSEDIGRGHAERLINLVDEVFAQAELTPYDVTKIAVSVGPGSFTGIRVGVAAARGFALALDLPIVGVSTLEAIAFDHSNSEQPSQSFAVAISGGRGQVFTQVFEGDGSLLGNPFVVKPSDGLPNQLCDISRFVGNGALEIATNDVVKGFADASGTIAAYAKLGMTSGLPPKPIYLRAADAKIQEGFALPHAAKKSS